MGAGHELVELSICETEFGGTRCPPVITIVRAAWYLPEMKKWRYVNKGFTRKDEIAAAIQTAKDRGADYVQTFVGKIEWEEDQRWERPEIEDICAKCGAKDETVKPSPRIGHKLCASCFQTSEARAIAAESG